LAATLGATSGACRNCCSRGCFAIALSLRSDTPATTVERFKPEWIILVQKAVSDVAVTLGVGNSALHEREPCAILN